MKGLFILGLIFTTATVFAGNEKGNGGDICENRIIEIRNDIKQWIQNGGSKNLNLPAGLTLDEYNAGMISAINKTKISCTTKVLPLGIVEKTCLNSSQDAEKSAIMRCNFLRFLNTDDSNQYRLVYHEFAGIAGFETNEGDEESKYSTSNQITGYLENQLVKKLVVSKRIKADGSMKEIDFDEVLKFDNGHILRLDEITKRLEFYENNKTEVKRSLENHEEQIVQQLLSLKNQYAVLGSESTDHLSKTSYSSVQKIIDSKITMIRNFVAGTTSDLELKDYERRTIELFLTKKIQWERKLIAVESDPDLLLVVRKAEDSDIRKFDEHNSINFLYDLGCTSDRINEIFRYHGDYNYFLTKLSRQSFLNTDFGYLIQLPDSCLKSGGWGGSEFNFSLPFANINQVKLLLGFKDHGPVAMECTRGANIKLRYNSKIRKLDVQYTKEVWGSVFDKNIQYQYPSAADVLQVLKNGEVL